ncbi:MAG: ABC transporter permease [Peptostreptococcaceae bacterium]|nr:ABC transporter permease [Peptostreptococcaceae bacterium]
MLKECISMAWETVVNNRMRSFLTTLGIVIGIASVITLITVVQGVTGSMMSQFDQLGAGNVTITANGTALKSGLTDAEITELSKVDHVSGVAPSLDGVSSVERKGTVVEDVPVKGKNDIYFQSKSSTITLGRGFNKLDMGGNSYECIINKALASKLFPGENPVNQQVNIGGLSYVIIGVMENDTSLMAGFSGETSTDPSVIIPYQNALKVLGVSNIRSVEVYISDTAYSTQVLADLGSLLDKDFNYKKDSYNIMNMDTLIATMNTMKNMLTIMLAGIASISLLVGGIGIMNMMLTSVSERTKEIGLRKALGAEPGQIQLQFIVESIFLSIIGGIIGVITGLLLSVVICKIIGVGFSPTISSIILGVGFSAGVGIVFGWTPARKASNLNPIDALRSE